MDGDRPKSKPKSGTRSRRPASMAATLPLGSFRAAPPSPGSATAGSSSGAHIRDVRLRDAPCRRPGPSPQMRLSVRDRDSRRSSSVNSPGPARRSPRSPRSRTGGPLPPERRSVRPAPQRDHVAGKQRELAESRPATSGAGCRYSAVFPVASPHPSSPIVQARPARLLPAAARAMCRSRCAIPPAAVHRRMACSLRRGRSITASANDERGSPPAERSPGCTLPPVRAQPGAQRGPPRRPLASPGSASGRAAGAGPCSPAGQSCGGWFRKRG
jgi:hypothetical protein